MKSCYKLLLLSATLTILATSTAWAGQWKQDAKGWWIDNGDGSYPTNCGLWVDGNGDSVSEYYYFDSEGYCLMNTTSPDGRTFDASGAWTIDGVVQTVISQKTLPAEGSEARKTFDLINAKRVERQLAPLIWSDELAVLADARVLNLEKDFSHAPLPEGSFLGENIAMGYSSSESIVNLWLDSPTHASNIFGTQYNTTAIGFYSHNGVKYWLQLFSD